MSEDLASNYSDFIVEVNGGSGVIINPFTEKYSYIYTARHTIQIDKDNFRKGIQTLDKVIVKLLNGKAIRVIDLLYSDDIDNDIAILITEKQLPSMVDIYRDDFIRDEKFRFCGYPSHRRKQDEGKDKCANHPYRFDVKDSGNNQCIPEITLTKSNIEGMSGGGLFSINSNNNKLLLKAIENRYIGNPDSEFHGCINAIHVIEYDRLIDHYREQGKEIEIVVPYHLSSFKNILDISFKYSEIWDFSKKLREVRRSILNIANERLFQADVDLYPVEMKKTFSNYLEHCFCRKNEINDKRFWAVFFEVLVLSIMIDEPKTVDINYIQKLLKLRRIIYLDRNEIWQENIVDILTSKYIDHDENGLLIVRTNVESGRAMFTSDRLQVLIDNQDISDVIDTDEMLIDNVRQNTGSNKTLIDLGMVHTQCVTQNEDAFEECKTLRTCESKMRDIAKGEYSKYIPGMEFL